MTKAKSKQFLAIAGIVIIILLFAKEMPLSFRYFLDKEAITELRNTQIFYNEYGYAPDEREKKSIFFINGLGKSFTKIYAIEEGEIYVLSFASNGRIAAMKEQYSKERHEFKYNLVILEKKQHGYQSRVTPIEVRAPAAWSDDGKMLAVYREDGKRDLLSVYNVEDNLRELNTINISDRPRGIRWMKESNTLVAWFGWDKDKLIKMNVKDGKIHTMCEGGFHEYFLYKDNPNRQPKQPECIDTEEGRAMFGSPDNPVDWLIAWSPSGRFYFSHHSPDCMFICKEWIEAHDTLTNRSWKVHTIYGFWDNFF